MLFIAIIPPYLVAFHPPDLLSNRVPGVVPTQKPAAIFCAHGSTEGVNMLSTDILGSGSKAKIAI